MVYGRVWRWLIVLLLLVLALLAKSLAPRYELRSDAPPDFAAVGREYRIPQDLVDRYWEKTRELLSAYEYGQLLPINPPAGFAVSDSQHTKAQQAGLEKELWKQVRIMWADPGNWTKRYNLDLGWVPNTIRSIGNRIGEALPTLRK